MTLTAHEAFDRGTEAFNAHAIDAFAAVLADDVVCVAPGGLRGEGRTACAAFYGSWFQAFPDAHVEVHAVHFFENVAVEEGTFSGTHRGVLHVASGDVAPTGRCVELDYIQVLQFRDGKHHSFNLMFDRLLMLEQLGLLPVPG